MLVKGGAEPTGKNRKKYVKLRLIEKRQNNIIPFQSNLTRYS